MSFKYRFIFSFVSLEIFFILLIVSMNFFAINSSSKQLTSEKIESNISLLEQLIKVPISIYDLATLDNLLTNSSTLKYINSIIIMDNHNRILSSHFDFKYESVENILKLKTNKQVNYDNNSYEIIYKPIFSENTFLGTLYIIFDTTENSNFIRNIQRNTFYLILIEIFVSTILAYFIGRELTKKLTNLSQIAKQIGKNKIEIPYKNKKDEIGILSNSLDQMQLDLINRNEKLKKNADELEVQKIQLIEIQKYKDIFLANISHELKTPLNSINILSSLMMNNKNETLSDIQVKNIKIINSCGKNLMLLINDILDISKLEAKEIKLQPIKLDFKDFIFGIRDMLIPQMKEKNLEFNFKYDDKIGIIINDRKIISQIIINILANAIKFTSSGKIDFILNNNNEFIEIIIKDQGIGIPSDKIKYIFDRFKQLDDSINRKYGGSGLGLAICKELVDLLEGSIKVDSIINEGTTFTVLIRKHIYQLENTTEEESSFSNLVGFETNEKEASSTLIILNNEPVMLFDIIIELRRKNKNIIQVTTFNELKANIKILNNFSIVLDIDFIEKEELKLFINENKQTQIFLICKDKNLIDSEFINISNFVFEKPLNKKEFISKIEEILYNTI